MRRARSFRRRAALAPIVALGWPSPKAARSRSSPRPSIRRSLGVLRDRGADRPRAARAADRHAAVRGGAASAAYLIPTAVGGNADRLGALARRARSPRACCVGRSPASAAAAAARARAVPPLLAGQRAGRGLRLGRLGPGRARLLLHAAARASCARSASATPAHPARIEVVPTRDHWEARWLAPHVAIARGWERQLDRDRNALFYDESRPAHAPRATARGCPSRRSPTSRCPTRRSTTRRRRGAAAAERARASERRAGGATCAKSGTRRTGACSRCSAPRPLARGARRADAARQRLLHARGAARRDATRCACASPPTGRSRGGHGCVREAPGDWTELQARARGQSARRSSTSRWRACSTTARAAADAVLSIV